MSGPRPVGTCPTGKLRWRDRIAALLALNAARNKASRPRDEQRAYRCPTCRGWHLTSRPLKGTR